MSKLKWIDSVGGPLVLLSEKSFKLWSGVLNRKSYLENIIEDADDFTDADQADYGKACLVEDYLGVIEIGNDSALILGEEPMMTTVFNSTDEKIIIARWSYGESEEIVDHLLENIDLSSIDTWEFALSFQLTTNSQYLIDSACSATMLEHETEDYLLLSIKPGKYKIWTSIYEPDNNTKLILHKMEV